MTCCAQLICPAVRAEIRRRRDDVRQLSSFFRFLPEFCTSIDPARYQRSVPSHNSRSTGAQVFKKRRKNGLKARKRRKNGHVPRRLRLTNGEMATGQPPVGGWDRLEYNTETTLRADSETVHQAGDDHISGHILDPGTGSDRDVIGKCPIKCVECTL